MNFESNLSDKCQLQRQTQDLVLAETAEKCAHLAQHIRLIR